MRKHGRIRRMHYAIKIENVGGEFMATCRDVPAFATVGEDLDATRLNAIVAMELALSEFVDQRKPFPAPTKCRNDEELLELHILASAKFGLHSAMLEKGVNKAQLARMLGVYGPQVDRLLDVSHGSKIEAIEHALSLLGRRMVLEVEEAA